MDIIFDIIVVGCGPAGMAVGGLVGGLIGGLSNLNATREEALKRWREQDVKYDSAVSFYKDDDGAVKYKVDYQKMGTGGERSGEAVKEAQTRETQVWLGDDGRLKIKVSPIFASTARYKEITDFNQCHCYCWKLTTDFFKHTHEVWNNESHHNKYNCNHNDNQYDRINNRFLNSRRKFSILLKLNCHSAE